MFGVVEAAPPPGGGRGGHEGDDRRCAHPAGRQVAGHDLGHGPCQTALVLILVHRYNAADGLGKHEGARHLVVGRLLVAEGLHQHGRALRALHDAEGRAAARAGRQRVDVGERCGAGTAQHRAGLIAHRAAGGVERLGHHVGGEIAYGAPVRAQAAGGSGVFRGRALPTALRRFSLIEERHLSFHRLHGGSLRAHDRGNDAGMSRFAPRADRVRVPSRAPRQPHGFRTSEVLRGFAPSKPTSATLSDASFGSVVAERRDVFPSPWQMRSKGST